DGLLPDYGVVHQDGTHADERAAFDARPVHDHAVPQADIVLDDRRREAFGHVDAAEILQIDAAPDAHGAHVAANHRAVPDVGVLAEHHVADHGRALRQPNATPQRGSDVFVALDQAHRGSLRLSLA